MYPWTSRRPELVAAVVSTSSSTTSTTVPTLPAGTRLDRPGRLAVAVPVSVGMSAPDWLIWIQLPRCAGVNSQATKFMTVAVLAAVIVLSACCEVTPHWPLPFGPPIMPTVEVPSASGEVSDVMGGSGNTPYLPVKPAESSCGMYQLPPHKMPTLPWTSMDCGLSGGVVVFGLEHASKVLSPFPE